MTKQELLESFRESLAGIFSDKAAQDDKEIIEFYLEVCCTIAETFAQDKWIDCKDRLPIDNTRCLVLVHRKNETQPSIEVAKKFEAVNLLMRNRDMDDNFLIQGIVTHWMPLPQKPLIP